MVYCSNRGGEEDTGSMQVLEPGNYGLSNSVLDCPWRKVQRGKVGFEEIMKTHCKDEGKLIDSLMKLLGDDSW